MAKNVIGLFDDQESARRAIDSLTRSGFANDRISVIASDQEGAFQRHSVDEGGNIAAEGAVTGLTSGAVVGGILGFLVGTGAIFIPGGFLAAGPIAGLITGAAAGAATGGILGGLIGMGIPKEHADVYAEGVRRGGVIVAVEADEREDEAETILLDHGAVDVEERRDIYRAEGFERFDENAPPYTKEQALEDGRDDDVGRTSFVQDRQAGRTPAPSFPETSGLGATEGSLTDSYTGLGPHSISTGAIGQPIDGVTRETVRDIGAGVHDDAHATPPPVVEPRPPADGFHNEDAASVQGEGLGTPRTDFTASGTPGDFAPSTAGTTGTIGATSFDQTSVTREPAIGTGSGNAASTERTQPMVDFRSDFDREFAHKGMTYEQALPAFEYGYQCRNNESFRNREWNEIEQSMRDDWESRQPGTWIMYREIVRSGWERPDESRANRAELL
ncbi:MAG TPA: general stress protein [Fimbriimonas sp.]